jgi:hypothetical protein
MLSVNEKITLSSILNELITKTEKDNHDIKRDFENGELTREFKDGCICSGKVFIDDVVNLAEKYGIYLDYEKNNNRGDD